MISQLARVDRRQQEFWSLQEKLCAALKVQEIRQSVGAVVLVYFHKKKMTTLVETVGGMRILTVTAASHIRLGEDRSFQPIISLESTMKGTKKDIPGKLAERHPLTKRSSHEKKVL
jgi:hypothetical protein